MKTKWQCNQSFDAIVFDCDGTLSRIEGIDELAEMNEVGPEIKALTASAMGEKGLTTELYEKRLKRVRPTSAQLATLAERYCEQVTPFASTLIQDLQLLDKAVYILSAGLLPPVQYFGNFLGVPPENIFAVDVALDEKTGAYQDFDRQSPLTTSHGKADIIKQLRKQHKRIVLIGDGMNDALSAHAADCFIGFGGNFHRPIICGHSHFYITVCSLLPVLSLCVTENEVIGISPVESDYKQAVKASLRGEVQTGGKYCV